MTQRTQENPGLAVLMVAALIATHGPMPAARVVVRSRKKWGDLVYGVSLYNIELRPKNTVTAIFKQHCGGWLFDSRQEATRALLSGRIHEARGAFPWGPTKGPITTSIAEALLGGMEWRPNPLPSSDQDGRWWWTGPNEEHPSL